MAERSITSGAYQKSTSRRRGLPRPYSAISEVAIAFRFFRGLPSFLKTPFSPDAARIALEARRAGRATAFLALARRGIYGRTASPYRELLKLAGCELGDLQSLVTERGLEGALRSLFASGVYLTSDELKGRRPVRRGSAEIAFDARGLVNPAAVVHGLSESSGSRGPRSVVPIDFAFIRDHAVNTHLTLQGHGGGAWVHAHWGAGGTAVTNLLEFAKGGASAVRWFTPIHPSAPGLHPRYRWGARALRWGSVMAGAPLPLQEHVPLDDPLPIARWMASVLADGQVPHLWTFSSSAVLVCQAAHNAGVDLEGARFTMGGEPTTAARRDAVRRMGAVPLPRYGSTETDIIAFACGDPEAPDDMHFLDDRHALIQVAGELDGGTPVPGGSLLVSSLLASAPILLLNASLGDRARLDKRPCGCPLARLGWATHVSDVRSFEKLTAGGMTFVDTEILRVLEEVLPARFGGAPTDYQLLEEEDSEGIPRVRLLVHPRVGDPDPRAVADAFLDAAGQGSGGERLMALQWRGAGLLRVERAVPRRTASGKILHLHAAPRASEASR